jgi:hypothetical protein
MSAPDDDESKKKRKPGKKKADSKGRARSSSNKSGTKRPPSTSSIKSAHQKAPPSRRPHSDEDEEEHADEEDEIKEPTKEALAGAREICIALCDIHAPVPNAPLSPLVWNSWMKKDSRSKDKHFMAGDKLGAALDEWKETVWEWIAAGADDQLYQFLLFCVDVGRTPAKAAKLLWSKSWRDLFKQFKRPSDDLLFIFSNHEPPPKQYAHLSVWEQHCSGVWNGKRESSPVNPPAKGPSKSAKKNSAPSKSAKTSAKSSRANDRARAVRGRQSRPRSPESDYDSPEPVRLARKTSKAAAAAAAAAASSVPAESKGKRVRGASPAVIDLSDSPPVSASKRARGTAAAAAAAASAPAQSESEGAAAQDAPLSAARRSQKRGADALQQEAAKQQEAAASNKKPKAAAEKKPPAQTPGLLTAPAGSVSVSAAQLDAVPSLFLSLSAQQPAAAAALPLQNAAAAGAPAAGTALTPFTQMAPAAGAVPAGVDPTIAHFTGVLERAQERMIQMVGEQSALLRHTVGVFVSQAGCAAVATRASFAASELTVFVIVVPALGCDSGACDVFAAAAHGGRLQIRTASCSGPELRRRHGHGELLQLQGQNRTE